MSAVEVTRHGLGSLVLMSGALCEPKANGKPLGVPDLRYFGCLHYPFLFFLQKVTCIIKWRMKKISWIGATYMHS